MVKNKKCHSKKMAALVTAVVLAVSATVSFAVPQVKAANGPVILVIGLMLILM